ncbi:hypothetical protein [Rhodococcoides yunnanense]|uniref:hypothetical protein n=1 Tax=Rhodococcoides yunnanense TaxID=278209 RepID=UPI00093252CD|nr:hypothetical protein [Rhodococcus yunnanensis]
MTPESTKPTSFWAAMATEVDRGNLSLSPEAAAQCDAACTNFIAKLEAHRLNAGVLREVKGLGTFPSGIELAQKFSEKAAGGTNSLVDVLQSHIDVVMQMQAVFQKFFSATDTVDQDNAAAITQQNPPR